MFDPTALADASNALIYSSMLALTVAMVLFFVSFAQRGSAVVDIRERTPALVGGGSPTPDAPGDIASGPDGDPGRRTGNMALAVSWLAFALLTGGVIARALWAGRVPWGNMYEFSLMSAYAVLGVFLVISTRRDVRWLGVFIVPAVLLTLGLAVTVLYTEAAQLVPALRSYWLVIHVSAAVICGGAFTFSGVVALLYLAKGATARGTRVGRALGGLSRRLPEAERLDRITHRTIMFTFPLWTFAIVAGAIWAESAWGRYWGWDPKETWAFISWVVYAAYLHARSTVGWRGRKAAWLAVLGLVVFWFNYFGVNLLFSGLHSYSGL
ncbi:MAG: c-type cytochrome biogenesis protein CcsB [Candidatus Nanopelagicales bacterium]